MTYTVGRLLTPPAGEHPAADAVLAAPPPRRHDLTPREVFVASTRALRSVEYPRGHVFFTEGDVGDQLYLVISGKVKIGCSAGDGRRVLHSILGPTEVFGELSALDPGPRTSTATALVTVCAAAMPRELVRAWITERPEIAEWLLGVLARRLRRTQDDVCGLIFTDVPARVAKALLRLAHQFGVRQRDGALRVTHDLTQDELAQLVGATRVSVSRVLADFTQRGWIRWDATTVLIIDAGRLTHRAR